MKIEIIRRCRVRGKDCNPGEVIETDKSTALDRIGAGLAKAYKEPPQKPQPSTAQPKAAEAEGKKKTTEEPKK